MFYEFAWFDFYNLNYRTSEKKSIEIFVKQRREDIVSEPQKKKSPKISLMFITL